MIYQVEVLGWYEKKRKMHRIKWKVLVEAETSHAASVMAVEHCESAAPTDRRFKEFAWHSVVGAKTPMILGASDSAETRD